MGLDMYLTRKHYVRNWDYMKPEERHKVTVLKNELPVAHIKPERIQYVIEEVGYWRKANGIHRWFVENVQSGNDDCGEYLVSAKQLKDLLGRCERVIKASVLVRGKIQNGSTFKDGEEVAIMEDGKHIQNAIMAHKLLPTQDGFFFGSTDYDEFYFDDVKHTREMLAGLLAESGSGEFYYQSSW